MKTYYERGGPPGQITVGAGAAVLRTDRLLLTRRADNDQWCLPSGAVEPGETPAQAAVRETEEETGLVVRVTELIGVHSDPDLVTVYPDGNRREIVGVLFRAVEVAGEPGPSDEVTEVGWFTPSEAAALRVTPRHRRILSVAYGDSVRPYFD